jgi:uncharacterized membrane protein
LKPHVSGAACGEIGIDDNFIKQTDDKVTLGTYALFLMTASAVADRLVLLPGS